MNETRGNSRTKPMRGGLKGGEINSLKDSEKTNDLYYLWNIGFTKPPKIIYYELRIWKNHDIITMNVYTTLKSALNYYYKKHLNKLEDNNQCYVEIVKIENVNPRYK